ncbi:MAG TPA: ABC transporter ATP-binding protein [Pseudonocardiaceae bacterium]|jgi:ABC-type multidrug transport system ATPase subunit|nr:ABC transporter ATP-binding protein [Pseudonocardiaceae bacterium]
MGATVRLSGIGKRYGDGPWVLADVDLELTGGDVVAVTGGNGAGKSTLLRVRVGLTRPTTGAVGERPAVIGYVPDRFPPHDRMSARAYLTHLGRMRGLSTQAAGERATALLDRLSLVGGAGTALRRLSRGNAQKVALAQALLVEPELLILDEPWSGLDASAHDVLSGIIGDVRSAGGCVVFTDHREAVTSANATRTYRIHAGRLTGQDVGAVARVELRRTSADAVDLATLPGVVDVRERERAVVRVDDDQCDAVLRAVLDGGWSVLTVRRTSGVPR